MVERTAVIQNAAGIHCRPAAEILKVALGYPGELLLSAPEGECSMRSALDIISLCLTQGTEVKIRVDGPNEEDMADQLVKLFETHFDFPDASAVG